jgi:hypothetical protein
MREPFWWPMMEPPLPSPLHFWTQALIDAGAAKMDPETERVALVEEPEDE